MVEIGNYKTRAGDDVRVICVDYKNPSFPVIGLINVGGYETVNHYTREGKYISSEFDSARDIMKDSK